jgi:hypothetical protein
MDYTTRVTAELVPQFMKDLVILLQRDKVEPLTKSEGDSRGFSFLFEHEKV